MAYQAAWRKASIEKRNGRETSAPSAAGGGMKQISKKRKSVIENIGA